MALTPAADRAPAPAVTAPALDGGRPITLAAFRGRPVLLNFWASWCEPCQKEMPALVAFSKEHPGLSVVGLAVNDRPAYSRRFARKVGADFPLGIDRDADVAAEFDATTGLPDDRDHRPGGPRSPTTIYGPVSRTALEGYADQLGV